MGWPQVPIQPNIQQETTFYVNGHPLKNCENFKYLGSILGQNCNLDREIDARISAASAAFGKLRQRVFENNNLRTQTKAAVYRAICLSTLLYSAETWTPYRRHIKKLEAFHIMCLRRILGVTWKDHVLYDVIFERTGTTTIESSIARKHLQWVGHTIRMPETRLPRQILYGQMQDGYRDPGGPKKRYKDYTKQTLKKCGINSSRLEAQAQDRPHWRHACTSGVKKIEEDLSKQRDARRRRRHAPTRAPAQQALICHLCNRTFSARIGLISHTKWHQRQNLN